MSKSKSKSRAGIIGPIALVLLGTSLSLLATSDTRFGSGDLDWNYADDLLSDRMGSTPHSIALFSSTKPVISDCDIWV